MTFLELQAVTDTAARLADAINAAGEAQHEFRAATLVAAESCSREEIAEAVREAVEDDPDRDRALQGLVIAERAR